MAFTVLEDKLRRQIRHAEHASRRKGHTEGHRAGLAQGMDHERKLLCRLAARRFGAGTAARLAPLLVDVGDADRLERVGEWIVDCADGDALLARFGNGAQRGAGRRSCFASPQVPSLHCGEHTRSASPERKTWQPVPVDLAPCIPILLINIDLIVDIRHCSTLVHAPPVDSRHSRTTAFPARWMTDIVPQSGDRTTFNARPPKPRASRPKPGKDAPAATEEASAGQSRVVRHYRHAPRAPSVNRTVLRVRSDLAGTELRFRSRARGPERRADPPEESAALSPWTARCHQPHTQPGLHPTSRLRTVFPAAARRSVPPPASTADAPVSGIVHRP